MNRPRTPKAKVTKAYPTAISCPPNPRGMYYDQWTVIVPPVSCGVFGPMARILGHGASTNKAWADAANNQAKDAVVEANRSIRGSI